MRVLEVVPNSPAELAGLQPMTDYLLGTAETVFKDPDVLEEILGRNLEQTVDFYVYNTETDTVRTATLMPNLKWGGRGCLGAEIGHGYLHGLPDKCCRSNGTSVFKPPAPHIADATRGVTAAPTGGGQRWSPTPGGTVETGQAPEISMVDVNLQAAAQKNQPQQQQQQQPLQQKQRLPTPPPPPPAPPLPQQQQPQPSR